jgi:hypothetical protein
MIRSPSSIGALWILSFCLMATVIGFVSDAPQLLLLEHNHAETLGEVTRLLPASHGLVEVRYVVAGSTYQGTFAPHLQSRRIDEGDSVRVYYSPRDPKDASIFPPDEILAEQLPSWLAGSLLLSVGLVAAVLTLWNPNPAFRRISGLLTSPKLLSAGVTVGVASGFLLSLFWATPSIVKVVAASLVLCGCALFLRLAWRQRLSWTDMFRSMEFWIAFALAISGNIIDAVL